MFIFLAVLGGYLYHQKLKIEEEKFLKLVEKAKKIKKSELSEEEINGMKACISHKFIENLAKILSNFQEYQKISKLKLSYKPISGKLRGISRIDGSVKYTILSIYPVSGSIKKRRYYVVEKEDIIKGENKSIQGIIDKVTCGEKLLNYGADLISLDKMKFILNTDDYKKFINALNYIYNCNFYFEDLTMSANNYSMSVILR